MCGSILLLAPLVAGCFTVNGVSSNAIPAVRLQASTDLDCPQRDLRVVKQEFTGHFEAIGCGRKLRYNALCDGLRCVAAPEGQVVPWGARPDPTPSGIGCNPDTVCLAH